MVTGGTSLTMTKNTALCHVPVGTVVQLRGASPHFSRRVRAFLDREFPDHWIGRGGPLILQISLLWSFKSGGL
jgi:hypothetical protein